MHITGHWCPSGLEVEGDINSIIQRFLIFCKYIILVQSFNYAKDTIYIRYFEKQFLSLTRHKGMLQTKHTTKVLFSFPSFEQWLHLFRVG